MFTALPGVMSAPKPRTPSFPVLGITNSSFGKASFQLPTTANLVIQLAAKLCDRPRFLPGPHL